jgi:hypothetical protein
VVLSAAVVLLAAGCSGDGADSENGDDSPDLQPAPSATADGWRTESFGDAEISVPSSWGYQTGDVSSRLWCISDASVSAPVMVRPGLPVEDTCPGPDGDDPDPSTLMEKAGQFVSMVFAANDPDAEEGTTGDRVTTKVGSVVVRVQAPSSLRAQILGTLHRITTDSHGCPVTDAISAAPARRPDHPVSVTEIKGITSVAACRYAVPGGQFANPPEPDDEDFDPNDPAATEDPNIDEGDVSVDDQDPIGEDVGGDLGDDIVEEPSIDPDAARPPTIAPLLPSGTPRSAPTLLSSVLLTGDAARDAIHGIADSRVGAGPDSPGGCDGAAGHQIRGTEEIVLRVTANSGIAQIYLRYGGCHNGFDDGLTERMLTRDAVAPFVSDANLIPAYGEELQRILDDPNAPATSGHTEEDQAGATAAPEEASTEPPGGNS